MKTIYLLTLIQFIAFSTFSQITITAEDNFASAGDAPVYFADQAIFDMSAEGEDQVWDFSTAASTQNIQLFYEDPTGISVIMDLFPETNLSEYQDGFTAYYNKSEDSLSLVGFILDGTLMAQYSDPFKLFEYPFTYLDSFEDSFNADLTLLATKEEGYRYGSISTLADGYGDLILPYATIENTLRLKTTIEVTDSLNGAAFDATQDAYYWFDAEYFTLLATYSQSDIGGNTAASLTYISQSDYNSIEDVQKQSELFAYPNPTINEIHIIGVPENSEFQMTDLNGRTVLSGLLQSDDTIDTSSLIPGVYILSVTTENGIIQRKIMKD